MVFNVPPPPQPIPEIIQFPHPNFEDTNPGVTGRQLRNAVENAESASTQQFILDRFYVNPDTGLTARRERAFDERAAELSTEEQLIYEEIKKQSVTDFVHYNPLLTLSQTGPAIDVTVSKPLSQGTNIGQIRLTNLETKNNAVINFQFYRQSESDPDEKFRTEFAEIKAHLDIFVQDNPQFANWLIENAVPHQQIAADGQLEYYNLIASNHFGRESYVDYNLEDLSQQEQNRQNRLREQSLRPGTTNTVETNINREALSLGVFRYTGVDENGDLVTCQASVPRVFMHETIHEGLSTNITILTDVLKGYTDELGVEEPSIELSNLVIDVVRLKYEIATTNYTSLHMDSFARQTTGDNERYDPTCSGRFAYTSIPNTFRQRSSFAKTTLFEQFENREEAVQTEQARRDRLFAAIQTSHTEIEQYLLLYAEKQEEIRALQEDLNNTVSTISKGILHEELSALNTIAGPYRDYLVENKQAVFNYIETLTQTDPELAAVYIEMVETLYDSNQIGPNTEINKQPKYIDVDDPYQGLVELLSQQQSGHTH